MDQETFTKLVQTFHRLDGDASEVAVIVVAPLLALGVVCGIVLARWIFRGGLSRSAWRMRGSL